jgi:succinyl-CoA synthetase beta subunit
MYNQITELTFLKMYASRFAIPVPEFIEWPAQRQVIQEKLNKWKGAIAKPDILAGGRGKAGVVGKVTTLAEAVQKLQQLASIEVKNRMARTSYLVQFVPAKYEAYTAITYDSRFLSPAITISLKGGVDVESIADTEKKIFPVDVYKGLDAYQAQNILEKLKCPKEIISPFSRALVNLWDMFITTGMKMCEINPWRISPDNKPVACDFKAVFDAANFKQRNPGFEWPEYPETLSEFEEDMHRWESQSYQGQAHVSDLNGKGVLPITFGGGASTIITETLIQHGGDPMFLADFGGNPPYDRMRGTAAICFRHKLAEACVLLILGGKANNTRIDVTFSAIADALTEYAHTLNKKPIPVVVGRGGPGLIPGLLAMQRSLEELGWPYTIFGPDTPITMVAEYAADLYKVTSNRK